MPTPIPPPRDTPAAWNNRTVADILALGNVWLGVMILLGGPVRLSGVSFRYVNNLAPWWAWALVLIIAGVLSLYGTTLRRPLPARLGHTIAGTVCLFWVIAFYFGSTQDTKVSYTGIAMYGTVGLLHHWLAGTLVPRQHR